MRRASLLLAPLLPLSLSLALAPRQEPASAPLPEGVVARLDGEDISLAEYQDYLWRQTGKRMLPQLVDDRLIARACERFGVEADPAEVEARVAERLEQLMQGREAAVVEAEMRVRGFGLDTLRENLRAEFTRNGRLDALVRATRVATDVRLRAAFEAAYGPGGKQVEVRQVLCMPHVLRAERIRAGADPASIDQEAMREEARALAEAAHARIAAGEDFATVVNDCSHDQATKASGGVLAAYRPGLYGAEFTAAVEALEIGEVSGIVASSAGFHVVQVTRRTVTEFRAVRAELVDAVMQAEPTWQEREELLAGLRARAKIELW